MSGKLLGVGGVKEEGPAPAMTCAAFAERV